MGESLIMSKTNQSKQFIRQQGKKQIGLYSILITTLSVIIVGAASIWTIDNINEKNTVLKQLEATKADNRQAVENNRQAQEEFQRVQDSDYLAQIARRDYYYSKEGEIIFDLKED